MKTSRQLLGEKIRYWRESAGLTILQLAEKMGTKRTFIYDIEAGRKNFTVEYWEKLLRACGVSPEQALLGFTSSDIPAGSENLFQMLRIIIDKGGPDLLHGITVNLDAISDKALRLHKRGGDGRDAHPPPRVRKPRSA